MNFSHNIQDRAGSCNAGRRRVFVVRNMLTMFTVAGFIVLCASCASRGPKSRKAAVASHDITIPVPPAMLTSDSARLEFIANRYWNSFDFRDTTWLTDTVAFEQAFANWAGMLGNIPIGRSAELAGSLIGRIAADTTVGSSMLLHFTDIAERYWRDPNSPFRCEEFYIPVLEAVIAAPNLDTLYKIRPRAQLEAAMKNRPGMKAADFEYTVSNGQKNRLSQLHGEYILLMFYNPGCHDCGRVEKYIADSEVFAPLIASGRMAVLAVYVDEELAAWREHLSQMPKDWIVGCNSDIRADQTYDLPAIPNLYLLDSDKRVVFKDAPVERIEEAMQAKR